MGKYQTLIKYILFFIISLVIFNFPISAFSSNPVCDSLFLNHTKNNFQSRLITPALNHVKNYGHEIIQTRGLRLFLKNNKSEQDATKWYGLLTKQKIDINQSRFISYFTDIVEYVPRKLGQTLSRENGYLFTPFDGLYNLTFRMPIEYFTSKFFNRKLEPAFFLKIPVILALSFSMSHQLDVVYQNQLENHLKTEISDHSKEYDKIIQSDYRYRKIKNAIQSGQMTRDQAYREAYLISLAYSQYFKYRDSNQNEFKLESELKLLDHYLFEHLKPIMFNGIQKSMFSDDYFVPTESIGLLTDDQKILIFKNAHQRYLKYQIIVELVNQSELWKQMLTSEKMQQLIQPILQDPFTVELMNLYKNDKISRDQLQTYLQEDMYWQNRFLDYDILGIKKYKKINGISSNHFLTLADIREEILLEIVNPFKK